MVTLDTRILKELQGLMGENFPSVFQAFKNSTEQYIAELEMAIDNSEIYKIEQAAHTLKGSSANIGATRFSELCASIVEKARKSEKDGYDALYEELVSEYELVSSDLDHILKT